LTRNAGREYRECILGPVEVAMKTTRDTARGALICGVLSLLTCGICLFSVFGLERILPLVGLAGFICAVAALTLGWVAWRSVRKGELAETEFPPAAGGLLLGGLWFGIAFFILIIAPEVGEMSRAKVAKTLGDMRNLVMVLKMYHIDNKAYPPAADETGNLILGKKAVSAPGSCPGW